MNNEDNTNLDLLNLDDGSSDSLPEVAFVSPRPKKPWRHILLFARSVAVRLRRWK